MGDNITEHEMLTDLVPIVLGLGKLVLNGIVAEVGVQTGGSHTLGYLEPKLKAYAYQQVNLLHKISSNLGKLYLTVLYRT